MDVKNLRRARMMKGLQQNELAPLLGISASRYSAYETGKAEPDNETLLQIADVLEVDVRYLLGAKAYENVIEDIAKMPLDEILKAKGMNPVFARAIQDILDASKAQGSEFGETIDLRRQKN